MTTRLARLKQIVMALGFTALAVPTVAYAQSVPNAKLDESLRESVERGCAGTQSVIITTKPGYRQALRDSLAAHGDVVKGEFPSLEAIAADVHCEDLATLAGVRLDNVRIAERAGRRAGPALATPDSGRPRPRATLVAAKATMLDAQKAVRAAEKAAALADAQVIAAKRALILANRLTGLAKTTAVAAAQAKLAQARRCGRCSTELRWRRRARTQPARRRRRSTRRTRWSTRRKRCRHASAAMAQREREGKAARALKKKFFATMPVRASQLHTDADLDNETVDYTLARIARQTGGGTGIGVAVIDSGIEPGTDFDNRITAFYDFTHGDIRAVTPIDPYGHGTHVAGLDRERVRRRRAERAADRAAGARREGAGRHGQRRARHRVRDREQGRCSASTS